MSVATSPPPVWFRAVDVARYFLELAAEEGTTIDQIKLHNLIYFAHGWHLALEDRPLIDEQVLAWKYGPMIPSIFRKYRGFGVDPIVPSWRGTERALEFPPETLEILEQVWEVYGVLTGTQLSKMTREEGSPWSQVHKEYEGRLPKGTDVPPRLLKEHFAALALKNQEES